MLHDNLPSDVELISSGVGEVQEVGVNSFKFGCQLYMLLADFCSMVLNRHLVLVQLGSSHEQAIEDETVLSGEDISVRYSMLLNQLNELSGFIV